MTCVPRNLPCEPLLGKLKKPKCKSAAIAAVWVKQTSVEIFTPPENKTVKSRHSALCRCRDISGWSASFPPHPLHGSSRGFRDGPFAAVPTKSYTFLLALIISSFIRPSLKLTCSSSLSFLSHMFVFSFFFLPPFPPSRSIFSLSSLYFPFRVSFITPDHHPFPIIPNSPSSTFLLTLPISQIAPVFSPHQLTATDVGPFWKPPPSAFPAIGEPRCHDCGKHNINTMGISSMHLLSFYFGRLLWYHSFIQWSIINSCNETAYTLTFNLFHVV